MDRIKKVTLTVCCLISVCTTVFAQDLPSNLLGEVTQAHGTITFAPYHGPTKIQEIKVKDKLEAKGSYLTHDDSFATVKLFDGSFFRASPRTKFSVETDQATNTLTLHLFTGSVKILVSNVLNKGKLNKVIVRSSDGSIEASESKFSVVRNPLFNNVSTYVEKGTVTISRTNAEKNDLIHLHALEMASFEDRNPGISEAKKIKEKELKFLNGAFYLKSPSKSEI